MKYRCHACGRVNEVDLSLCDEDTALESWCGFCGRYHDEDAIRLTPLQADAAISNHGDGPEQTAAPLKPGR